MNLGNRIEFERVACISRLKADASAKTFLGKGAAKMLISFEQTVLIQPKHNLRDLGLILFYRAKPK